MKKVLKTTGTVFTVILSILTVLTLRSGLWMLDTWKNVTADELFFHLKAPLEGTNEELLLDFVTTCLLPALFIGLLLFVALFFVHKHKIIYRIFHVVILTGSLFIMGLTVFHVWKQLSLTEYVSAQVTYSSFIDTNYVSPEDVQITFPQKKRNLIHIYLESMETTFSDQSHGGAFEENVIPEITELALKYEDFSGSDPVMNGAIPLSGTSWTMGALFGQTSGLPLLLPIDGNAMSGQSTFLPNVISLGDLLEQEGYQQAFLIGSDATFGGRRLYFQEHGSYEMWDYNYFRSTGDIPEDHYVWWGYEDKYLTEFAKEKLTWLSQQEEPFNLTMLTVDTHYEDGYTCSDCRLYDEDDPYSNVFRCSSSRISELIQWIQQQDFYENTTIVLTGDHLTMDGDYCEDVSKTYQRKVVSVFINAAKEPILSRYRDYSTFDIFPSTLASLGVSIEGDRLALGTNLFSSQPTLVEEYGRSYVNNELKKQSKIMDELTADVTYADGTVTVTSYRPLRQTFDVMVNELDYSIELADMRCLVWTKDDQSDAKWYVLPYSEENEYRFTIPLSDFEKGSQVFHAKVFAYSQNTIMYSLGSSKLDLTE